MDKMSRKHRWGNDCLCLETQEHHMKEKIYELDFTGRVAALGVDRVGKDQGVPCRRNSGASVFGEQARGLLRLGVGSVRTGAFFSG